MNGKQCIAKACIWHVEWSDSKVELFAPNWTFVAMSRDSGKGPLYESIAETMNAALFAKVPA